MCMDMVYMDMYPLHVSPPNVSVPSLEAVPHPITSPPHPLVPKCTSFCSPLASNSSRNPAHLAGQPSARQWDLGIRDKFCQALCIVYITTFDYPTHTWVYLDSFCQEMCVTLLTTIDAYYPCIVCSTILLLYIHALRHCRPYSPRFAHLPRRVFGTHCLGCSG